MAEIFNWKKYPELITFALVIATTVHAQDFQDVDGDREIGRNTVPMMFPLLSRVVLLFLVPLWTIVITLFSGPPMWLGAMYYGLSLVVGIRCVLYRSPKEDAWTNFFYSVSFTRGIPSIELVADDTIAVLAFVHTAPSVSL